MVERPEPQAESVPSVGGGTSRAPFLDFLHQFSKNRLAVVGLVLVLFMVFLAVFAPHLAPMSPYNEYPNGTSADGSPLGPTWQWHHFFLGTDNLGRDITSRLIYGARVSMEVGVVATVISLFIGIVIGLFAGYAGGWVDMVLMRVTDVALAFPIFLFAILLDAIIPEPSVQSVFTIIGVLGWAPAARIARAQTLSTKNLEYIEAARSLGATRSRILTRHILPAVLPPVLVYGTLLVPNNIIIESALSFLGVGVPDPIVSWGKMINVGLQLYRVDPLLIILPGVMILIATLGFNLLGDGLNDALSRRRRA